MSVAVLESDDQMPLTPRDYARRAVEEGEGNRDLAAAKLREWAEADPELYRALTATSLHACCYRAVGQILRDDRHAILKTGGASVSHEQAKEILNGQAAEQLRAGALSRYLLPSGRSLAKSTVVDLDEAIDWYRKRAHAYIRNLLFVQKLRAIVKKGQFVEDAVTDEQAVALLLEADQEAEGRA